jgi:hypothetical protein
MKTIYAILSALLLAACSSGGGGTPDAGNASTTPPAPPPGVVRISGLCVGADPQSAPCQIGTARDAVFDLGSVPASAASRVAQGLNAIYIAAHNNTPQQAVVYTTWVPGWGCTRDTDPLTLNPGDANALGQYTLSCNPGTSTAGEWLIDIYLIEAGTLYVLDHVVALLTLTP